MKAGCSGETPAAAFELLETMLRFLRARGTNSRFLSELCDYLAPTPLRELSIEKVIRERRRREGLAWPLICASTHASRRYGASPSFPPTTRRAAWRA